ncbi:alpha-1,2-mannosyltransferase ALG9 isoform X2 [Prorops nasuta]|uniref:alpha-1,2-mannosyltransferase ALG9 isoform X2 n=1 Tax=Prorops nasuta TaxID=863751 RepID=UPI0034CFE779
MAPNQRQRHFTTWKKEGKKLNERRLSKHEDATEFGLIFPSGDTAFKLLLSARFCSAIWSHITDCDETYNYWEPSHYLLYGNGQQTWEYSPDYALRSYTYLLMHIVPAKLYQYLREPNPIIIFYFIRCLLSMGCALSEVYFYKNVCKEFGIHIARLTLGFLILSSGMFISSAAFLPSSFSMYFSTAAIAAWYDHQYELAIFATAISSILGWPFAALLGLPIAIEMLFNKKQWLKFFKWVLTSAIVILIPVVWIDSVYFGKLVVAPLNIILYNVFTSHGPDLYGTEPFSYYFVNLFLNFNFVFLGALFAPFGLLLVWYLLPAKPRNRLCLPYYYSLSPLYLWIFIFFIQPHKEERFLFPIYPIICLAGAIFVDVLQKLYFFLRSKFYQPQGGSHYLQCTAHFTVLAIAISGSLGLSRSFALHKEKELPNDITINFCIGKEWHRFPNSFFFPTNNWKLRYLQSEFKGQLPQAFLNHENATSIIQSNFNNLNKEESSRYFNVDKCHFLLDFDNNIETKLEPNYSRQTSNFIVIKSSKFLDNSKSHPLFRAFYIPFLSAKYCKYGSYNLLQNIKLKPLFTKQKTNIP